MSINRNVIVPIPAEANHPKTGKRVFLTIEKHYDSTRQFNVDKRLSIGEACSETEMYPNDTFKLLFPDIYNEHAPHEQQLPAPALIIGPYAAFLAIGIRSGVYRVTIASFGPQYANMIMDYGMYSILMKSNVSKDFQATMDKHLLFSDKPYSDTWISFFFKYKMTENQGHLFRQNWAQHCREQGITSVWLCIDGSNDDCDSKTNGFAEQGHDKSGSGGPIVSYMWAVSAKDGTPVTYRVYRGSRVDSKELKEIVAFLSDYEIKVEGVILDRGFWNIDDVKLLLQVGYDFLIMMKDGVGFSNMLEKHGDILRSGDVRYMLKKSGFYGVTDKVQVFTGMTEELNVALIYSNSKNAKKTNELTDKVKSAILEAEALVKEHKAYTLPAECKPYIIVEKHRGRKGDTFSIDTEALQKEVDSRGFAALACSKDLSAQEIDDIYQLRQASEKQYAAFKTQLGFDVLRVYAATSWESKFSVGFIAGIMRNEFQKACVRLKIDVSLALKELSSVTMVRMKDNHYLYVHLMSRRAAAVLGELGLVEQDMDLIAADENNRQFGPYHHPIHELPVRETVKRKPGRPKGSQNLKPKKKKKSGTGKRGRPAGSKNKKTLAREAEEARKKKEQEAANSADDPMSNNR